MTYLACQSVEPIAPQRAKTLLRSPACRAAAGHYAALLDTVRRYRVCLNAIVRLNVPRPRERCQPPARERDPGPDGGGARTVWSWPLQVPRCIVSGLGARSSSATARVSRPAVERAAAERSEHLMVVATGSGLRELHRQAADLHRQALHHWGAAQFRDCTPSTSAAPRASGRDGDRGGRRSWCNCGSSRPRRRRARSPPGRSSGGHRERKRPRPNASSWWRSCTAAGRQRASFGRSNRPLDAAPARSAGSGQERPGSGGGAAGTE